MEIARPEAGALPRGEPKSLAGAAKDLLGRDHVPRRYGRAVGRSGRLTGQLDDPPRAARMRRTDSIDDIIGDLARVTSPGVV